MKNNTKQQLLHEVEDLRRQVAELEASQTKSKQAEESSSIEKNVSESIINSLPGIFYLFNEEGKFLQWNKNLEEVSGYSNYEISAMMPLDFFVGEEKDYIAEKIREVFSKGRSVAEANLVTKDGRNVPYFFTGLRTEINNSTCLVGMGIDITERKRAEEALRHVHRELHKTKIHLESLIENCPDAVIETDRDGNVTLFNSGAEALLGYRREEILGRYVTILYESEERAKEVMHRMREGGSAVAAFETILRAKDGSPIPVLISAFILYDGEGHEAGTVGFNKDLRERKRAEDSLCASEARNRALLEGSPVCTKIVDLDLQLQFMSGAGQKMLRIDDINAFYERPYADIYIEPHRTLVVKHLERARAGEITSLEAPANDMQGREGWYYTTFVPVRDSDGQVDYIISTSIDITERKLAEEELRQAHEELQRAYDVLERAQASAVSSEKLAALGQLTAGVSHEILNPLNIITMRLYMMLNDPDVPPEMARQLLTLEEQANRITKISKDLLYFSRQRPPEPALLNLNDTVSRTLGLFEYDLRKDNIAVELRQDGELPPVLADQDQLQQMVLNLLTNARDAMPDGGQLIVSTDVAGMDGYRFVELRVEDTGEGIAPEHLDKLFDPFFTTKPEGKGTGLGLSICHGIIKAHGGSIWAESEKGRGTTFFVQLPLEQVQEHSTLASGRPI